MSAKVFRAQKTCVLKIWRGDGLRVVGDWAESGDFKAGEIRGQIPLRNRKVVLFSHHIFTDCLCIRPFADTDRGV